MKQEEKMTDPYRLGDMVRFFGTEEYGMNKEYVKQFPGTIGNKYWKHAENKTNDYSANMNTLVSIVNEHCANTVKLVVSALYSRPLVICRAHRCRVRLECWGVVLRRCLVVFKVFDGAN